MKKALLIGLAVCLGVALAAPAMAIDWSATGYIGIGFLYHKNQPQALPGGAPGSLGDTQAVLMPGGVGIVNFGGSPTAGGDMHDDWNEESAYVHTRAHLKITARASEDLYGVFHFEMDSTTWGEAGAVGNAIGAWGTDTVGVEVKNVYIDFRVPPKLPIWLRVGMQTFMERPGWFFVRDGAGVSARIMIDPVKLSINPYWAKEAEGRIWRTAEERDIFGIDMNLPIGPVKVGGFFMYDNDKEVTFNTGDECEVWWLGAYVDGKVGPVKFTLDFAYDDGEWDRPALLNDIEFQGWGFRGVADATFGIFNVGLGGLYYSGGDGREITLSPGDREYEWFVRPSSEQPGTYDDSVIFGGWVSGFGPGIGHMNQPMQWNQTIWGTFDGYTASMSGIWGIRVFGSVQPLDWLKIFGQVAYWGDTTHNGDTYGSEWDPITGWYEDNNEIGWELDFGAHVNLYKNLQLRTAFGYLIAGRAIDQWNPNTVSNDSPSDPWAWHSSLIYTF